MHIALRVSRLQNVGSYCCIRLVCGCWRSTLRLLHVPWSGCSARKGSQGFKKDRYVVNQEREKTESSCHSSSRVICNYPHRQVTSSIIYVPSSRLGGNAFQRARCNVMIKSLRIISISVFCPLSQFCATPALLSH